MTTEDIIAGAIALSDEDFKRVVRARHVKRDPDYLEKRREALVKARAARKPRKRCVRGHLLAEKNVRKMPDGERRCRKCENIRAQLWRDRQKERKK